MSITSSGLYGLSLEKALIDTLGESWEAEDNRVLMVTDTYTPDFNAHDFYADITNEVTGTGYTAGGELLTTTEITLSGGVLTFDAADVAWTTSTIANAMAGVLKTTVSGSATDQLILLSDFVTAASSSGGTFTIQWSASGIATVDYVP